MLCTSNSSCRAALLCCGFALALFLSSACVGPDSAPRYARHFDAQGWSSGFDAQGRDAWQYAPASGLLAALPVALVFDSELSNESVENQSVSNGNTSSGDALASALGVGTLVYGSWQWANGDEGQRLEVGSEALLSTVVATHTLKLVTGRERPRSFSHDSFPSGHSSLAFCGATFLARSIEADTGSKLGYLLWFPATYVAVDRVEAGRHWASDVVGGALVGIVLTNWVWNAHYGEPQAGAIFERGEDRVHWQPKLELSDAGLTLGLSFSF